MDTVPHVLTVARILDRTRVFVVQHEDVPNPNWLRPGMPSAGQQTYGDSLLHDHPFVLVPSVVSTFSWNLIFNPETADTLYAVHQQDRFALDTSLHQPA